MRVIVNKIALEKALKKLMLEERTNKSPRIDYVPAAEEEEPIEPTPQMATQLSVDMPPVEDPEYIPANLEELSRAASVIAAEVPENQIEFFYRKLHNLLDVTLDRHDENERKNQLSEDAFRRHVLLILEDDDFEDFDDRPLLIEDELSQATENVIDYFMSNKALFLNVDTNPETGDIVPRATEPRLIKLRAMGEINSNRRIKEMIKNLSDAEQSELRNNVTDYLSSVGGKKELEPGEVEGYVAAGKAETEARVPAKEMAKIRKQTGLDGLELSAALRVRADEIEAEGDIRNANGIRILADEIEQEENEPEDSVDPVALENEMLPDEVARIRTAERQAARKAALESEGPALKMSSAAIKQLKDEISAETGLKVNNIQNILYDDLKVFGFSPEDATTLGFPTAKKIPDTYDPLKLKAQEQIVGTVYDLFRSALRDEIENEFDDESDTVLEDLLDGEKASWPGDGIDGYLTVQNTAVAPRGDIDPSSKQYLDQRNSYESVIAFIQEIAKEVLDSEKIKGAKEGGIRAFIQQLNADGVFKRMSSSDIDTTEAYETYMQGLINDIENVILDEKLVTKLLGNALKKAPKRTEKFMR
jgi:hypothetical protein|tara:strand:+ start:4735 stop:6504 length:1770 start_codon:yes stop_codon:yes gene_type:complete